MAPTLESLIAERDRRREETRARARAAFERGSALADDGDLEAAARWLERAHRLARRDPTISFSLALLRLRRGEARNAAALLLPIARSVGTREAWIGIAIARRLQGLPQEAAHMLEEALGRTVIDADDASTATIAGSIAAEAGAAGWCGIDPSGRLVVAAIDQGLGLDASIDGRPLELRRGTGSVLEAALGEGWERAASVRVRGFRRDGPRRLLGGELDLAAMVRVDGCVAAGPGGTLTGWATRPGAPAMPPALMLLSDARVPIAPIVASRAQDRTLPGRPFGSLLHGFEIDPADLPPGLVHVVDGQGRDLPGSPLDPGLERRAAASRARASARGVSGGRDRPAAADPSFLPVPADLVGPPPTAAGRAGRAARRRVDVVVPVYRDLERTLACLDSLAATLPADSVVHVMDDASPEAALRSALETRADAGAIALHRWRDGRNRGFPAAANAGIEAAAGRDVILLNSDTLVAGDWFERLRAAAYRAPDIGSATPLTNEGSIFSYPLVLSCNDMPGAEETGALMADAATANDRAGVEVPTGNGFCMFLRRDCLDQAGAFREDLFAQGYGEENDFCLRARHLGWRHVAALDVFVAHVGGISFRAGKASLIERNLAILNRLHPGYDALIAAFAEADPLAPFRRRLDEVRHARRSDPGRGTVIVVTHQAGGGVERVVRARIRAIAAEGLRPIVLRGDPEGLREDVCLVAEGLSGDTPNLRYVLGEDALALTGLLAGFGPVRIEIHHLLGHSALLAPLLASLAVPIEVHLHDYAWFCHRIALIGPSGSYCGEPPVEGCRRCVAEIGSNLTHHDPDVDALLAASASLLGVADIVAPSTDSARRLARHFPGCGPIETRPWEAAPSLPPARTPLAADPSRALVVAVVGAIGPEKGLDVLVACARDAAARSLPLRFVVVGHTSDDARLMQAGPAFVVGPYDEDEATALIRAQGADIAFLPSIWPETWCFALSEAWKAGLEVVAFDIGTQAERIRDAGIGALLGFELAAPARAGEVNDALLAFAASSATSTSLARESAPSHHPRRPGTRNRSSRPATVAPARR